MVCCGRSLLVQSLVGACGLVCAMLSFGAGGAAGQPTPTPTPLPANVFQNAIAAPVAPQRDESAEARQDRLRSASQYDDLSDSAAIDALRDTQSETVEHVAFDGLDLPSDASVAGYGADQLSANVVQGSDRYVVASSVPLRSVDADTGHLASTDLGIEASGAGYVDVNAPVAVAFPGELSEGLTVGGISLAIAGADASAARVDDSVAYPNALPDTDVIAQTATTGAEISLSLRSPASPEDFPFVLRLPEGASAELAATTADAPSHIEITAADGTPLAAISAPAAWDAEDAPVSTRWKWEAGQPVLHVDHSSPGLHWPLLVDPTVTVNDNRYYQDLVNRPWTFHVEAQYATDQPSIAMFGKTDAWGTGLYQYLAGPYNFAGVVYSYFDLSLIGRTAGISQVHVGSMNHDDGSNAGNGYGPGTATFVAIKDAAGGNTFWLNQYGTFRNVDVNAGAWNNNPGYNNNRGLVGMYTIGGGTRTYYQQFFPILVAAVADYEDPTVNTLDVATNATGWTKATNSLVTATASDPGTGVLQERVFGPGTDTTVPNSCPTSTVVCNTSQTTSANFPSLPQGISTLTAIATDGAGRSATRSRTVGVDRTPPGLTLTGALNSAAGTSIDAGAYPLTIAATDGNASAPGTAQSGVASISIFVDGTQVYTSTQGCTTTNASCPMTRTWTFEPGLYGYGPHAIKVSVADLVGNPLTERTINVIADCCFARATSAGALSAGEVRYGDVNGDDLDDIVVRNTSTGALSVRLAGPTGPGSVLSWGTWPTTRDFNLYDIDGDNREDLVGRDSAGTVSVARSTGTAFAATTTLTTLAASYATMRIGDVDGDGRGDIVGENPSTGALEVVLTNGSGAVQRFNPTAWTAGYTFILADVDGDGSDDAVGRNVSAGTVKVGFSVATDFETRNGPWTIPANADFAMADVNGDGLADLLYRPSGSTAVSVRTAGQDDTATTLGSAQIWGVWAQARDLSTADVNGDGLLDLASRDTGDNLFWSAISYGRTPDGLSTAGDSVPAPAAAPQSLAAEPLECQNASTMKMAMMDDGRLLYHQNEAPDEQPGQPNAGLGVAHTVQRMATLGVQVVRLTVYWGAHENKPGTPSGAYFWTKLNTAIDTITSTHVGNDPACPMLEVHLTLTGLNGFTCNRANPTDPTNYNPDARDCDASIPLTGVNPDTTKFGTFVENLVRYYESRPSGGKPSSYSIWNEPNLPSHKFLSTPATLSGGAVRELLTAARYRSLYVAGYRAAQLGYCEAHQTPSTCVDPLAHGVNVFIGELSEQTVNGPTTATGNLRKGGYSATDYLYEVLRPPTNSAAPIVADGFALHPYQHTQAPDRRGPNRQIGIGKLRAPIAVAVNGSWNRVGVVAALDQLRYYHGTTGVDTDANGNDVGPKWLRTPSGGPVPLYITEFGYFNLVPGAKAVGGGTVGRTKWKTDSVRASYFTDARGPHTGAIYEAQVADARWMTIHTLSESGSTINPETHTPWGTIGTHPDYRAGFDTGLIAPVWRSDWKDVTDPRPYGKGAAVPYTDVTQPRTAYCAIYNELKAKHFPTQQTGVPC